MVDAAAARLQALLRVSRGGGREKQRMGNEKEEEAKRPALHRRWPSSPAPTAMEAAAVVLCSAVKKRKGKKD
jgi:hypothetical protein